MRYAVIENEAIARHSITGIMSRIRPGASLVFEGATVREAITFFATNNADLVFMDIELDDGDCFDIFSHVSVRVPIIFTTAYDAYALRAFRHNSIDYLLKPVTEDDVKRALDKLDTLQSRARPDYGALLRPEARRRILLRAGDSYGYVNLDDVALFESEDKCIFVLLAGGTRRLTEYTTISEALARVSPAEFFQVSRGVAVNIRYVRSVRKYFNRRLKVTVDIAGTNRDFTVSAARRDEFLEWLGGGI